MSASSQPNRPFKADLAEPSANPSATLPRRFAADPIETTIKSSKHKQSSDDVGDVSNKAPRKFVVEPVEVTHTNSKGKGAEAKENEPRKFAVQPVETSHVSNKNASGDAAEKKPRRFAPEPLETSQVSSKGRIALEKEGRPRPRFAPQLLETSEKEHKRRNADKPRSDAAAKPAARKFAPQLVETAQRSRKAGDVGPAVLHSDRTEATPDDTGNGSTRRRQLRRPNADPLKNTPYSSPKSISEEIAECRRLGKPLPKRQNSRDITRAHSFYVPGLAPIESSESDRSGADSRAASFSSAASDMPNFYTYSTRRGGSVGDGTGVYFFELAARAAEKQMRDQALAAFPNDDRHDPVDHYIDKDRDEDPLMSDHGNYITVEWELLEMRKHAEGRLAAKEEERKRKEAWRSFQKKHSANSPWGNAAAALYQSAAAAADGKSIIGGLQERDGLKQMQNGARPPLLGKDIEFPRCPSPEPARFDVTQGSERVREALCSTHQQSGSAISPCGLWNTKKEPDSPALWSRGLPSPEPDSGLWAGYCVRGTGLTPPRGPTGLETPRVNLDDAEDVAAHARGPHQLPPSPPPSSSGVVSLEEKLELEQAIDDEFSDAFVTQVYNYLSLGYPSMARKYDFELAKIARMEVCELRQDDAIAGAGARGYIRLSEENGLSADMDAELGGEAREEHCARWRALKLYVREWARQQPGWQQQPGGWGTTARRGSWAW